MRLKDLKSKLKKEKNRIILGSIFLVIGALTLILGSFWENYKLPFGAYQFIIDASGNDSKLENITVYYNFQEEKGYIEFFAKNAKATSIRYSSLLNITSIKPEWIKTEVTSGKDLNTLIIRGPIYRSSLKIDFKGKLIPNGMLIFGSRSGIFTDCKPTKEDLIRASTNYTRACMILELGNKYRCNNYCIQGEENCKNLIITQNGSTIIYMFIPDERKNINKITTKFKLSTYDYDKKYWGGIIKGIGISVLASSLFFLISSI